MENIQVDPQVWNSFLELCQRRKIVEPNLYMERWLRQIIEREPVRNNDDEIWLTISVGVAEMDENCADFAALIEHADQAMLAAKKQGRNRTVPWNELAGLKD